MIYSLPNGKTIELSIEQFLRMSDDDFKYLVARNTGEEYGDPFYDSALGDLSDEQLDTLILETIDDEDEGELTPDLTEIPEGEKFCDEDFFSDDLDTY